MQTKPQVPIVHFFVVTKSGSLYRVSGDTKFSKPGALDKIAPNDAEKRLEGDTSDYIGILHDAGVAIYYPLSRPRDGQRPRPDLSSVDWLNTTHTSGIVALFLEQEKAEKFLRTAKPSEKDELQKFWKNLKNSPFEISLWDKASKLPGFKDTLETLGSIGDCHPRFILDSAFARLLPKKPY